MSTLSTLESVKLIFVDVTQNNNKVWQAELRLDGLLVQWGRVGSKLQQKFHAGAGYCKLDRLKREKLAKGYTLAQTIESGSTVAAGPAQARSDLKQVAIEQIQADSTAKRLIEYLTDVNIHSILSGTTLTYQGNGSFTTPLGAVTPSAIAQARRLLVDLSRATDHDRAPLLNSYLRLIPQNLGSRVDSKLFSTNSEVQQQQALLDSLESVMALASVSETVFDCSLNVVPHDTDSGRATFRQIKRLFESSINASHQSAKFKLKRLYRVQIPSLESGFETNLGNVQQLWHGTRSSNLLSILKNGLIIPPPSAAQCTGRMFGNGLYFSNQSTKSLNYSTGFWNQSGGRSQRVFMLLADIALGREYRPVIHPSGCSDWSKAPKGFDSVWVQPGTCSVVNHEAIVYRLSQVKLRYLCEFE